MDLANPPMGVLNNLQNRYYTLPDAPTSLYTLPLSTTNTREYLSTSDIGLITVFSEFADKRKTVVRVLHSLGEKNVIYSY